MKKLFPIFIERMLYSNDGVYSDLSQDSVDIKSMALDDWQILFRSNDLISENSYVSIIKHQF